MREVFPDKKTISNQRLLDYSAQVLYTLKVYFPDEVRIIGAGGGLTARNSNTPIKTY
jgi:hypothetical protein